MEYSKDIIGFILGRDMVANPGERMNYNSGCSHLLSAIIQKVSGKKASAFAEQYLFNPLGMTEYHWLEKQKVSLGANGLRISIQDMLKFGYLYLKNGSIEGKEILPADWVEESTKPRFITYDDIGHYGMHWWASTLDCDEPVPYFFAMGLFGQFIIVVPKYDLVTVFVSENYGETIRPLRYFREYVAPAVL
jgi:CubicO group peptidase (beta-lactamase class C family)